MVSINNSKDLIANSLQLVQEDGELKDIKEVIATAAAIIEGDLTPEQIQTISSLSSALNNDPNFFNNNQAQINSKAAKVNVYTKSETDGKISDLINDAPETLNTLNKLASALGDDENFATTITEQIATKAPLANPVFTGTVFGVTKSMVGLGNVDNTSDADKEISIATQTALNLKSDKLTTYTKTEIDNTFLNYIAKSISGVDTIVPLNESFRFLSSNGSVKLQRYDNDGTLVTDTWFDICSFNFDTDINAPSMNVKDIVCEDIQANSIYGPAVIQIQNAINDVTSQITKSSIGLPNVDNTSDVDKPLSAAAHNALNLKSDKLTTYTKTESDAQFAPKTETQTALDLKANQATTYTKSEVDTKFTDIIDSAPDALNTLAELANALANDSNYATTIANQLATKAPQATTYTKTETDTLLNAKEDVLTAGNPANGFPILSGKGIRGLVATAPLSLTNDGSTSLTVGLDTSNIASKAEVDGLVNLINTKANLTQIFEKVTSGTDTFLQLNSNFRFVASNGVLTIQRYDNDGAIITDTWLDVCSFNFNTELNTSTLSIRNIESDTNQVNIKDNVIVTGNFSANGDSSIIAGNLNVYGNETIGGNLTVTGDLIVNGSNLGEVTKESIGLGNVDNTSDADKEISIATQTALNLKAPINNPSFTSNCTVGGNLIVNGPDIYFGSRRAVVNQSNLRCVLNFAGDFANGVTVQGPELAVDGDLVVGGVNVMTSLSQKQNTLSNGGNGVGIQLLSGNQIQTITPTTGITINENTTSKLVTIGLDGNAFIASSPATVSVSQSNGSVTIGLDKVALANDFEEAFDVVAPLEKVNNILTGNVELRLNPAGDIEANEVLTDALRARTASQITINDNVNITGNLLVNGTMPSPFWVAGRVNGAILTTISSQGAVGFSLSRPVVSGVPNYGVYRITFDTPHPIGNGYYTVLLTNYGNTTAKVWEYSGQVPTVNNFCIVTYNSSGALSNETFYFAVIV